MHFSEFFIAYSLLCNALPTDVELYSIVTFLEEETLGILLQTSLLTSYQDKEK